VLNQWFSSSSLQKRVPPKVFSQKGCSEPKKVEKHCVKQSKAILKDIDLIDLIDLHVVCQLRTRVEERVQGRQLLVALRYEGFQRLHLRFFCVCPHKTS
jgi:hypothetical protein